MAVYNISIIPEHIRIKMEHSRAAAAQLESRYLKCPYCGFRTEKIYADTAGHLEVKCQKCKKEIVYNLTPGTYLDFRKQ